MLPQTIQGKKTSFALVLMAADLRMRDIEDFCDNLFSLEPPLPPKEEQQSKEEAIEEDS